MANVQRLPGPIADIWEWQVNGLCRGRDSMQFFHPDGERGSSRNRRELKAKELCAACPVRSECAAHALRSHEPYGVWGGFTEAERLRLLAVGWKDTADRYGRRVDIAKLEARLGPAVAGPTRPSATGPTRPAGASPIRPAGGGPTRPAGGGPTRPVANGGAHTVSAHTAAHEHRRALQRVS